MSPGLRLHPTLGVNLTHCPHCGGLRLHPTLGVNPHLTHCPHCGGDSDEIVLIGAFDYVNECCECGIQLIGGGPCPKHPGRQTKRVRKIEEHERLPASQPCAACRTEIAELKAEVDRGGVYFRCTKCKANGVIKAEAEVAIAVRKQYNKPAPQPIGIELPACAKCTDGDVAVEIPITPERA